MLALSLYTWQVIALAIFILSLINGVAVMVKTVDDHPDAPAWLIAACWTMWTFLVFIGWLVYFNAGTYSEIFK